jgi:hypothetical protein
LSTVLEVPHSQNILLIQLIRSAPSRVKTMFLTILSQVIFGASTKLH